MWERFYSTLSDSERTFRQYTNILIFYQKKSCVLFPSGFVWIFSVVICCILQMKSIHCKILYLNRIEQNQQSRYGVYLAVLSLYVLAQSYNLLPYGKNKPNSSRSISYSARKLNLFLVLIINSILCLVVFWLSFAEFFEENIFSIIVALKVWGVIHELILSSIVGDRTVVTGFLVAFTLVEGAVTLSTLKISKNCFLYE